MKNTQKTILHFLAGLLLCLAAAFLLPQTAAAKNVISDGAQLLSSDEKNELEDDCDEITTRYDTSIYILTNSNISTEAKYSSYLKSIEKKQKKNVNLVILFVGVKDDRILCRISAYGTAADNMTEKRCRTLEKKVSSCLKRSAAADGLSLFCSRTQIYLGRRPFLDAFFFSSVFQLILCAVFVVILLYRILTAQKGGRLRDALLHYHDYSGFLFRKRQKAACRSCLVNRQSSLSAPQEILTGTTRRIKEKRLAILLANSQRLLSTVFSRKQ